MLIALASTCCFQNQIYFMKADQAVSLPSPAYLGGQEKKVKKIWFPSCSMNSLTQMRRTVVEVMQLLALINWAPSEEPQKCCLENTSGGLQFCISSGEWVLSTLPALTSPSPAHGPGTPLQAELAPWPPSLEQDSRCQTGVCQAWEPPAVHPAPLPGQPALLSWGSSCCGWCGLALWGDIFFPCLCSSLLKQWRQWPCGAPSVFAHSSWAGEESRRGPLMCLSVLSPVVWLCGVCVYVHMCWSRLCGCLCTWPKPAQPWYLLVLQAWGGNRIPLLD